MGTGGTERNDVKETHQLVASHMCPNQAGNWTCNWGAYPWLEWNPTPSSLRANALTTEKTSQDLVFPFLVHHFKILCWVSYSVYNVYIMWIKIFWMTGSKYFANRNKSKIFREPFLYSFPVIAVTSYHKFGDINHKNLFSHNSGGKFKITIARYRLGFYGTPGKTEESSTIINKSQKCPILERVLKVFYLNLN